MMRKIIMNYVNPADAKEPAVTDATNTMAFQLGEIESQLLDWLAWGEGPHPYPRIWPDRDSLGSWAEAISSAAAALRERDALAEEVERLKKTADQVAEWNAHDFRKRDDQIEAYKAMIEDMREDLIMADLTIRSFHGADQSDVEFIRDSLSRLQQMKDKTNGQQH